MPTILLIDDNQPGLEVRKELLTRVGYSVLTAEDGITGLALLFTPAWRCGVCGSGGRRIDAVVLDYRMPGMMGDAVAAIIRNEQPDLPIVALTGFPQDFLESPLLSLVDAVIAKGEPPQLLDVLEQLIGTKPERPPTKIPPAVAEARMLREQAEAIRSVALKDRRLQSDRRRTAQRQPPASDNNNGKKAG